MVELSTAQGQEILGTHFKGMRDLRKDGKMSAGRLRYYCTEVKDKMVEERKISLQKEQED